MAGNIVFSWCRKPEIVQSETKLKKNENLISIVSTAADSNASFGTIVLLRRTPFNGLAAGAFRVCYYFKFDSKFTTNFAFLSESQLERQN